MSCEDLDFPAVWPWAACARPPRRHRENDGLDLLTAELAAIRVSIERLGLPHLTRRESNPPTRGGVEL